MPKPLPGEDKSKYISRAIPAFMNEGFPQKVAVGRAEGFFKNYSGGGILGNRKKKGVRK